MLNESGKKISTRRQIRHGEIFYTNLPTANEQAETILELTFHHMAWYLNSYTLLKTVSLCELGH